MKKQHLPAYFKAPQKKRKRIPGESPGTFVVKDTALKSKIDIYAYNAEVLDKLETISIKAVFEFIDRHPNKFYWIDVQGLGAQDVLNTLQQQFNVNALVMEDVVNTHQRPKFEEFAEYAFAVNRVLELDENLLLKNEQLSFIMTKNTLITFQEDDKDLLQPVRSRLINKKGSSIRTLGPSYLMYAVIDVVTDHYFNLINRLGDELDNIEEQLYEKPEKQQMYRIQGTKKIMLAMRRTVWSERDKINEMLKGNSEYIAHDVKVFLRDVADHTIQVIDLLETYRETATTLTDIYLSLMSNKMNEVMKILTVISAIFIPLTFIAGIYGMNFSRHHPETGEVLPNNMPELYMPNGYIFVWILMLLITIFQLLYFRKKGWFKE